MTQLLLFADPRPLVERLGQDFFRQAPGRPGVYLMRDASDTVLYVGKAKNLRKRLASYRVANPDRMRPRHLRLLQAVARIDLEACSSEASARARESTLLQNLRPRFNRAGTRTVPARFLKWRIKVEGLDLSVSTAISPGWNAEGPFGMNAIHLRTTLVRLLWSTLHPARGFAGMPQGWFRGSAAETVTIPRGTFIGDFEQLESHLRDLFSGREDGLKDWVRARTAQETNSFEIAVREADLEEITKFAERQRLLKAAAE